MAAMLWCAGAAAIGGSLSAQTISSAPASRPTDALEASLDWVDQVVSSAEDCRVRLEQLRPLAGADANLVSAALKQGMDELAAGLQRLADPNLKAPPLPATRPAPKPEDWQASFRAMARLRRCQLALLRVQLQQSAATAYAPADPERAACLEEAGVACGTLRVEYREIPLAMLGYIFEARVQRLAGKTDASLAVLEPILKLAVAADDKAMIDLVRLGKLERLETLQSAGKPEALKEALQWRAAPELKNEPSWQGRLDWLIARCRLEELEAVCRKGQTPQEAEIQKCAEMLRAEGVVAAAPGYDRMEALARLDALAGGKVLTRQELLERVQILGAAGAPAATALFDRLLSSPGQPVDEDLLIGFARLFWRQGQWARAADVCDRILARPECSQEYREALLQLRAGALLKAAGPEAGREGPSRTRLLDSLKAVYESNLAIPVRLEALTQWVSMQQDPTAGEVLRTLTAREEVVRGSDYLLYCRALGNCQGLARPGASQPASRPEAQWRKEVEVVLIDLKAAQAAAAEANHPALLARSAFVQAQIVSRPPVRDARAALQILTDRRAAIGADKSVANDAAWLRVQLWMDLGMIEEASKELSAMPQEGPAGQAGVSLRLAEALAARYAAVDDASKGRLRDQVLGLCNRAMKQAHTEPNTYAGVARRSAQTLLAAGAGADAEGILNDLLSRDEVKGDPRADEHCRLLRARSLQDQGKSPDAAAQFDELIRKYPKSVAAHLFRGRFQLSLRQGEQAAESCRTARKLVPEGSPDWCEATLDLAAALQSQGQGPAAADILRVAKALHPRFGNDELRARLIRAQEQLKP